ncbi:hypothetical protein [Methylosinus sporium]|uniref:hypothetical protein n=1 Tax=Methylosinus sporium TaxID=428 RepID=UPI003839DB70
MIGVRIGMRGLAALGLLCLLSSSGIADTPSGAAKIVILKCSVPGETIHLDACDKSAGVETKCPALRSSCAEAVALFQSAPDNLRLLFVAPAAVGGFWYTLGAKKFD